MAQSRRRRRIEPATLDQRAVGRATGAAVDVADRAGGRSLLKGGASRAFIGRSMSEDQNLVPALTGRWSGFPHSRSSRRGFYGRLFRPRRNLPHAGKNLLPRRRWRLGCRCPCCFTARLGKLGEAGLAREGMGRMANPAPAGVSLFGARRNRRPEYCDGVPVTILT